jgi:glycosyltransferase involved in cell wall biosynthesis
VNRLVHLCARLPVGGMESVVASLVRNVPRERYDSLVWCLEDIDALGRELAAEGRHVLSLGKRRNRDVGMLLSIARRIRAAEIDVLHCHDELAWFYGVIGARLAARKVKVVKTLHGRRGDISRRHQLEQRMLAAGTASIVCVSEYLRRQVMSELGLGADKVTTIANGIDVGGDRPGSEERLKARALLGLPENAIVVGSVGELSAVKNVDMMLEAVAVARQLSPALTMVLVGDGAHRERLQQKASMLGLQDTLFTGVRRDVTTLLPALDIYVCSSHYEGISLAILEAFSRGRAVVATAVGGNPELIEHDVNGVLVPKGDVRVLARELVRLADDAPLRERLGQAAHARAGAQYGTPRMIQRYLELYDGSLALR